MTKSIASVLALAVSTSIASAHGGGGEGERKANPYQSGSVSWRPGSGITLADSDEFKLSLKGRIQVQYQYFANDSLADVNTFLVRRARINLDGHVFTKDLLFKLQLDTTDSGANATTKDAWAQWNFSKTDDSYLGLRVGQSKVYYGLESTGTSGALFFVERSASTRTFSDIRSQGAWVHGAHSENMIRWTVGAQNGEVANGAAVRGEELPNDDNELNFVGSVSIDPLGDIMRGRTNESYTQGDLAHDIQELRGTIGAGVAIGNQSTGVDVETTSINVNTAWYFGGGLAAQGEVYIRSDEPEGGTDEDSTGFYVAGMYTLPKSADSDIQWGLGVRFDRIDLDDTSAFISRTPLGTGGGDVTEVSVAANAFYQGHLAKTQFEYTWQDVNFTGGAASDTNHLLRIMFTLAF